MPRIGIPVAGKDAICEDCELLYRLDEKGQPKTQDPYTCDNCGGSVEAVKEDDDG